MVLFLPADRGQFTPMLPAVLFCSVLFCSVLFCSVLFCSVLFCSVLFCSVLVLSLSGLSGGSNGGRPAGYRRDLFWESDGHADRLAV
jgi:hypothetical protein